MTTKLTYAKGDTWSGAYVDGRLELQGHSLDFDAAVQLCMDHCVDQYEEKHIDLDWMDEQGHLPMSIADVKWAE